MNKILGLDIGGTSSKFGVVSQGKILFKESIPTCLNDDPMDFVRRLKDSLLAFPGIEAIGIGAPNGNPLRGSIEYAPNLKWKGVIPLAQIIEKEMGLPTKLTNDANAAAMGEMKYGHAQNMKNFIMITLGTGLGSGVVVNGEVLTGHSGFAGELGQTIVEKNGRLCGCGRRGCLETYASATGIVKTAQELLNDHPNSKLQQVENLSAKDISNALDQGDELAQVVFKKTGEILGIALANAVAFSSPEAIFLFGGLAESGDHLMRPTQEAFEENLHNIFQGTVKLLRSGLPSGDAAILGAASLF